jgi:hypothetical protein
MLQVQPIFRDLGSSVSLFRADGSKGRKPLGKIMTDASYAHVIVNGVNLMA